MALRSMTDAMSRGSPESAAGPAMVNLYIKGNGALLVDRVFSSTALEREVSYIKRGPPVSDRSFFINWKQEGRSTAKVESIALTPMALVLLPFSC